MNQPTEAEDDFDWRVRAFVYRHIVERERPPTASETAAVFGIDAEQARAAVDRCQRRTGADRGEVLGIEQVWALSRAWYHDRLDDEFRGRTLDSAQTIFRTLGLVSPFWNMTSPK